jgi:hypothetical protein
MATEENLQEIEKLLNKSKKRVEAAKDRSNSLRLDDSNLDGEKAMIILLSKLFSGDIRKQIEDFKLNKEQSKMLLKLQELSKENTSIAKNLLNSDEGKKVFSEIFGKNAEMAKDLVIKQIKSDGTLKVADILNSTPEGKMAKEVLKEVVKDAAKPKIQKQRKQQ